MKAGRRTVLNDKLIDQICEMVKLPITINTLISKLPVSKQAFYGWLNNGQQALEKLENNETLTENDQLYLKFYTKYKEAQADFEIWALDEIIRQGKDDPQQWKAIAWFLKRRFPERWEKQSILRLIHSQSQPIRRLYRSRPSQA